MAEFTWKVGSDPPPIDAHSIAKLDLIDQYLEAYFPVVASRWGQERLNITLVDGFSGGGVYLSDGEYKHGSPFVLVNAVERAKKQLNKKRSKPIEINARFYFVDKNADTLDFLRAELAKAGLLDQIGKTIFLQQSHFVDAYPTIQNDIESRTKRAVGRSIFVLDQKGYKDAPLSDVAKILNNFSGAEVILTFAVDFLINYMKSTPEFLKAISPVGISSGFLKELIEIKDESGGRYVIQRRIRDHLVKTTGARFVSPFFIRSKKSNRDLWVVHLSNHAKARNVMVDTHWGQKNHSIHPGRGGLEIHGFDVDFDPDRVGEFLFEEHQVNNMNERLAEDMIKRIHHFDSDGGIQYSEFINSIVNETPARLSDLDYITKFLVSESEAALFTKDGTIRGKSAPNPTDIIKLSPAPTFAFKEKKYDF